MLLLPLLSSCGTWPNPLDHPDVVAALKQAGESALDQNWFSAGSSLAAAAVAYVGVMARRNQLRRKRGEPVKPAKAGD